MDRARRANAGKNRALDNLPGEQPVTPRVSRSTSTPVPPLPLQKRARGRPKLNEDKALSYMPKGILPVPQSFKKEKPIRKDPIELINADDQQVAEEEEVNTSLQDDDVVREPPPALPDRLPFRKNRMLAGRGFFPSHKKPSSDESQKSGSQGTSASDGGKDVNDPKPDETEPIPPHRLSKERLNAMLKNKELSIVGPRDDALSRAMRVKLPRRIGMEDYTRESKRLRMEYHEPTSSQQTIDEEEVIEELVVDEQIEEWNEEVVEEVDSSKKTKRIGDYGKKKTDEELFNEVYEEIEIEGIKEDDPRLKVVGVRADGTAIVEMVETDSEMIEFEEELLEPDGKMDDDMEHLQPSLCFERPPKRRYGRQMTRAPKRFVSNSRQSALGLDRRTDTGIDLPDEHMPKQRAQHVLRLGLVPAVSAPLNLKTREFPSQHQQNNKAQELYRQEDGTYILATHAQQQNLVEEELIEEEPTTSNQIKQTSSTVNAEKEKETVLYEQVMGDNGMEMVFYHDEAGNEVQLMEEPHEPEPQQVEVEEQLHQEHMQQEHHQEQQHGLDDLEKDHQEPLNDIVQEVTDERSEEIKQEVVEEKPMDRIPNKQDSGVDEEDLPPQLDPEDMHDTETPPVLTEERNEMGDTSELAGASDYEMTGELIRVASPSGMIHEVQIARDHDGNEMFIDRDGHIVELVTDNGQTLKTTRDGQEGQQEDGIGDEGANSQVDGEDSPSFNFLDQHNVCCGICGEIVPYATLLTEHLPNAHPETIQSGLHLEEVPYDTWMRSRIKKEDVTVRDGLLSDGSYGAMRLLSRSLRQLRRVSQIRINPAEMNHEQLEVALKRKLLEKMSRKVPVSLVDRFRARCGICEAIVSLNKKFEVVHLVRHFNAWHPAEHRCSGAWRDAPQDSTAPKTLSLHDFAVVDTEAEVNNLQCIWCGMFMDRNAIGMHFTEVHPDEIEVPKCSLCLQEMVISARLVEKFSTDFGVAMPDEFRLQTSRFPGMFTSEKVLTKACVKFIKKTENPDADDDEDMADADFENEIITTNSRQLFGKRNRLKRSFVKPCFRQICPKNSEYLEPLAPCQWKCKICGQDIYGAVISAGAIRHFKISHPTELEKMQYELCQARLEKISDKCMTFVHPQLVECLICHMTYALHKPYNMCRAIRHLKVKHPEVMPEYVGKPINNVDYDEDIELRLGRLITDPMTLEKIRRTYHTEFDKAQELLGFRDSKEPVYILLEEHEKVDDNLLKRITNSLKDKEKARNARNAVDRRREHQMKQDHRYLKGEGEMSAYDEKYFDEADTRKPTMTTLEMLERELATSGMFSNRKPAPRRTTKKKTMVQNPPMQQPTTSRQQQQPQQQQQYEQYEEVQMVVDPEQEQYQYMYEEDLDPNVQYMTEEELREAQERGEVVFDENGEYVFEEGHV